MQYLWRICTGNFATHLHQTYNIFIYFWFTNNLQNICNIPATCVHNIYNKLTTDLYRFLIYLHTICNIFAIALQGAAIRFTIYLKYIHNTITTVHQLYDIDKFELQHHYNRIANAVQNSISFTKDLQYNHNIIAIDLK